MPDNQDAGMLSLHLAAQSSPQLFFAIAMLIGAIKCFRISSRPFTSTPCTRGLGLVLISFFLTWVANFLGESSGQPGLREGFRWIGAVTLLTGGIMAAVGLIQYKKADPPYQQGRAQAGWAIVISVSFVLFALSLLTDDWKANRKAETRPQVNQEFNLSFGPPPAGWHRFDAKTINNDALFAYRHRGPEMYFMVIAESDAYEAGMDTKMLKDVAKSMLQGADSKAKMTDGPDIHIGKMVFETFNTKARFSRNAIAYHHAVTAHNGYAYQLITWGPASVAGEVRKTGRAMAKHFRLIDPNRMDLGEGGSLIGKHESQEYGYAVDLSRDGWFMNRSLAPQIPESALFASVDGVVGFLIVPIVLGKHEPPLEASLESLLAILEIDYPRHALQNRVTVDSDATHELTFWYVEETPQGESLTNCRVVQQHGMIYLVAGFRRALDTERKELIERTVRSVRFFAPTKRPDMHAMKTVAKEAEALFFNGVGMHFYNQESYGKARDYFFLASSLAPKDIAYTSNVMNCYWKLEEYEPALSYINQQEANIQGDLKLQGKRAWLLAWAEQDYESMKLYGQLFEAGFARLDHVTTYLNLLEEHERIDEGLKLIAKLQKTSDSPLLQTRKALLLVAGKRAGEAIAYVTNLPEPRHATVSAALVAAYEADGKLAGALRVQSKLIADGYTSAGAWHTQARIEKELGNLDAAAKTVRMGLLHYENDIELQKLSAEIDKILKKD